MLHHVRRVEQRTGGSRSADSNWSLHSVLIRRITSVVVIVVAVVGWSRVFVRVKHARENMSAFIRMHVRASILIGQNRMSRRISSMESERRICSVNSISIVIHVVNLWRGTIVLHMHKRRSQESLRRAAWVQYMSVVTSSRLERRVGSLSDMFHWVAVIEDWCVLMVS